MTLSRNTHSTIKYTPMLASYALIEAGCADQKGIGSTWSAPVYKNLCCAVLGPLYYPRREPPASDL
jgi:hypothetical protein